MNATNCWKTFLGSRPFKQPWIGFFLCKCLVSWTSILWVCTKVGLLKHRYLWDSFTQKRVNSCSDSNFDEITQHQTLFWNAVLSSGISSNAKWSLLVSVSVKTYFQNCKIVPGGLDNFELLNQVHIQLLLNYLAPFFFVKYFPHWYSGICDLL